MNPATEAVRRRMAELRRARVAQHRLAAKQKRPPYSERVQAKLAEAHQARISGAPVKAQELEREAWDMDREDLEAHWRQVAIDETVALALARGEDVAHETVELKTALRDGAGGLVLKDGAPVVQIERFSRTVIRSRGGALEEALDKGWLQPPHGGPDPQALYDLGVRYRAAYEIAEGRTTNQGGEGGGGFGPKGPQLRVVEAGELLAITRRPLTARQRRVLDLAAGQDIRCRRVAAIMHAGFPSTQRALRGGLEAALEAWEEALRAKEVGEAAERVRRVTRIMRRAR